MKAICISACEVDGLGIVTPGEEIELPDGYAKDERIRQHFVIDEKTIKDHDAKVPDFEADKNACLEKFRKSLYNESEWWKAVNKLVDDGVTIPSEVWDKKDATLTDEERVNRLAEIWTESYGWTFPTDEAKKDQAGEKDEGKGEERAKGRVKGGKPPKTDPEDLFGEGK